eukprot:2890979-Pyramimonas_sp.AAC.1
MHVICCNVLARTVRSRLPFLPIGVEDARNVVCVFPCGPLSSSEVLSLALYIDTMHCVYHSTKGAGQGVAAFQRAAVARLRQTARRAPAI